MHLSLSYFKSITLRVASLLASLLIVTTPAQAKPSFTVKAAPAWSRTIVVETERRGALATATGSTTLVLDDNEIRVGNNSIERFYHYAHRIETTAGLDEVSQLKFYFEPSYQQLAIHFIRIHRGGSVIDALKSSEIKTIQQEEELDQQLYNGTFASVVFVNDLRVGDVVDYAYTVSGDNPVFGGRFADRVYLTNDRGTQRLSVRLLWPAERPLNIRNHNTDLKPAIQTQGAEVEYLWEQSDVPAAQREDSTPGWVQPFPAVDISEYKNWGEVVGWALPLFKAVGPMPPELQAKIQAWKTELRTPEERTVAALRFVQDEIRYLGIELGRYSHQPNQPAKVFARRFGDCKDKSLLLATILNSLGVDAAPALANPRVGKTLDDWQPTPFAFNHVIVQAKLSGKTYWLDSTISFQRGGLSSYYDPPYARALVLREGSGALEQIPPPAENAGSTTINQLYVVKDYDRPASFVVTTIYRGSDADAMRYRLSNESLDDMGKANLNYYAHYTPSIQLDGAHQVSDDQSANAIKVTERYIIEKLWNEQKHYFYADQIYDALAKPGMTKRSTPFEVEYPNSINQAIEIDLPQTSALLQDSGNIADEALRLNYTQSMEGNRIRLEYSLKSLDDHVSAQAMSRHLETIERMKNYLGIELPRGAGGLIMSDVNSKPFGVAQALKLLLLPFLIGLGVLIYKLRARRKRTTSWARPVKSKPGRSLDSPISVSTPADITSYLRGSICDCDKQLFRAEAPPVQERFTYDGQSLTSVRMKCASCGRSTDFYFRESPPLGSPIQLTSD
jgi:hypothetical protein